ncbi:Iron-dependent repressor IdeR [Salinivirga cyanobacteriivorans]|uniref:Transcriptional regulator MntR n=1 Tax=Salinivirga cyanobacteriivorans TaxID=1307839 RepID=A0A0S2I4G7_9BACT|nr:metal-dependent transcriptional regulator [Salinivirga cyanobacteriivorans]ALO17353.1 Iron-dependent repressor IdeR [Salinivirga cyanobacteriivorans]
MSISTENFIKTIYKMHMRSNQDTKPGSIARTLMFSNAAATDMAKKLAAKDLIKYEKYKALSLTDKGQELALKVLRKHRLWETFLHEVLHMDLHEIHTEAEMLEHQTSDYLANKLSEFLNHPKYDPHGDPIPDQNLNLPAVTDAINLSGAQEGKYIISRLFSSDKEFFSFCEANQIKIDTQIVVKKQYTNNKMTAIEIQGKEIILPSEFAEVIYVKPIN